MSDTIDPFSVPRHPVRTYGRRQKTPESPEDVNSFYQEVPASLPGVSPAKGLLNRFTTNSSGFLAGLGGIGRAVPTSRTTGGSSPEAVGNDDVAAEATEDEVQAMLRKMRQKPVVVESGKSGAAAGDGVVAPSAEPSPNKGSLQVKQILHRSSSLTNAPSSSLHSSPPPDPALVPVSDHPASSPSQTTSPTAKTAPARPMAESLHEETIEIRAPGHKRGKRVSILPMDEEDEDGAEGSGTKLRDIRGSSPTTPTAGPSKIINTTAVRSTTPDSPVIASRRPKSQHARRVQSSTPDNTQPSETDEAGETNEAAEEGASSDTEPGPSTRGPVTAAKQSFFDNLAAQSSDEEDAEEVANKLAPKRSESIEDAEEAAGPSRQPKIRAPTKKDKLQLQKDMAAAKRDRLAEWYRPSPVNQNPLSDYMLDASRLFVKREDDPADLRVPGLSHGPSSPASSALHKTPPDDPIEPYSSPRNQDLAQGPVKKVIRFAPQQVVRRSITPAAATLKMSNKPVDAEASKRWAAEKARLVAEAEKRRAMAGKQRSSDIVADDDSDLEIEPEAEAIVSSSSKPKITVMPPTKKGPDAKRVLEYKPESGHKQLTRAEQANLVRAGRSVRAHNASIVSETYATHAGKEFGHHNARNANGGATPAGQKQGRDQQIDATRLDASLVDRHAAFAHKLRMDKEKLFGKGRTMPERRDLDMEKMQELAKRRQDEIKYEEEAEDDEEDEDFVGSGEEGEEGDGEESERGEDKENEEPLSGEERGEEDHDEEDGVIIAATSSEPGLNVTLDAATSQSQTDDNDTPLQARSRKARKSRAVIHSDDEDGDETITRSPLAEINVQPRNDLFGSPTIALGDRKSSADSQALAPGKISSNGGLAPPAKVTGFGEFDVGGFGDDAGFSQLFDETQLNTAFTGNAGAAGAGAARATDGFAAMRATPKGFFVNNAFLPENHISDTQKERDAALVAGEGEEEEVEEVEDAKMRYLNDQGLYTQTKPPSMSTGSMPSRGPLAGLSTDSIFGMAGPSVTPISPGREDSPDETNSPTHQSPKAVTALRADSDVDAEDEGTAPLRRLKRRISPVLRSTSEDEAATDVDADTSSNEDSDPSAQPSPTQLSRAAAANSPTLPAQTDNTPARPDNAFQRMMTQARAARLGSPPEDIHAKRLKQKGRSALVDEQAEESDEDAGWGPTERGPDDEDDVEGDDGYVEGLVDDDKVDEALKRAQDRLAEEKMREIEKADDEKREAAARKVTEGEYRVKRKGRDFDISDSEDEDGRPRRRKLDKGMRRKMREMRKNDVELIGDEDMAAFRHNYEADSSDDDEDILGEDAYRTISIDDESQKPTYDAPVARKDRFRRSPEPESLMPLPRQEEPKLSWKQRNEMLQAAIEANKEDPVEREKRLDQELRDGEEDESESQYLIKSKKRSFDGDGPMPKRQTSMRSSEQLQKYVADEAATNRPLGGFGSSVSVVNTKMPVPDGNKFGSYQNGRNGGGRYGSGSGNGGGGSKGKSFGRGGSGILGSKNQSFAS